jgi:hypothetical protein
MDQLNCLGDFELHLPCCSICLVPMTGISSLGWKGWQMPSYYHEQTSTQFPKDSAPPEGFVDLQRCMTNWCR